MKKTVLITGVTGSIGKATAIEFAKKDCRVILLGRNPVKLSAVKTEMVNASGNQDIDIIVADLSEPKSVKQAIEEIKRKYTSLDALVNTAAIFRKDRLENSQGLEFMFATNHLGPFALTTGLLELLKAAKGRVITVTAPSTTKVNFDDLHGKKKFSSGFLGSFGASKMMNLLFTYALSRRMEGSGVSVMAIHPGLVKSNLTSEMPVIMNSLIQLMSGKPDKAAKMIYRLAFDKEYENTGGKFFRYDGKELKSGKYSYDKEIQERLWSLSEELIR